MSDSPFLKGGLRGIYRNADTIKTLRFTGKPFNTPLCLPCQCFTGPGLSRASTRGCIIPGGENLFTQQQSLSNAVNYSLFQKGIYHNAETTETPIFTGKLSNTPRLRCTSALPSPGEIHPGPKRRRELPLNYKQTLPFIEGLISTEMELIQCSA